MINTSLDNTATDQVRHAYNAAFEELGLSWHWDAPTYARLQTGGRDAVRSYLETEQSHLLRAYEADFLVDAIEAARARCQASMSISRAGTAPYTSWSSGQLASTGARNPQSNVAAHRFTPTSLHT